MGKIKIETNWISHRDDNIELKLKKKGVLRFDEAKFEEDGRKRSGHRIRSEKSEATADLGNFSWPEREESFVIGQLIEQGYEAKEAPHRDGGFDIEYEKADEGTLEVIKRLKEIEGIKSKLRFCRFCKLEDGELEVEYYGHEVGGSYVHDWQVTPAYIQDLEREANRRVFWDKERRSGGFGSDIYKFKVKLGKKLRNRKTYKPKYIHLKQGKTYKATEDFFCSTSWEISKGSRLRVARQGSGWDNQTELEILSGKIRPAGRNSFGTIEGRGEFETIDRKKDAPASVWFDPYGGVKFPCEEVEKKTATA